MHTCGQTNLKSAQCKMPTVHRRTVWQISHAPVGYTKKLLCGFAVFDI